VVLNLDEHPVSTTKADSLLLGERLFYFQLSKLAVLEMFFPADFHRSNDTLIFADLNYVN
jgi:hypothetical protein